MYKIRLTAKAKRELKSINKSDRLSLAEIIEELKEDPGIGKPLSRELIGKYSYRVGVYRIIYQVSYEDKIVTVLSAGHRGLVYN